MGSITTTQLYRKSVFISCPRRNCECMTGNFAVIKTEGREYFIKFNSISVNVNCAVCGKLIRKKYWTQDIADLAVQKKEEYKAKSMLLRSCLTMLVLILVLILTPIIYFTYSNYSSKRAAEENFAAGARYKEKIAQSWYQGLSEGDFILCHNYPLGEQVFQIESILSDIAIVKVFDQYFEYDKIHKMSEFKKLPLGEASYTLRKIKMESLRKEGYVEYVKEASESSKARDFLIISQIKKNPC